MDYTNYTVEDFAADPYFIDWVTKADPEAVLYWDRLLEEQAHIRLRVEQARRLVINLRQAQQTNPERSLQERQLIDNLWVKIQTKVEESASGQLQSKGQRPQTHSFHNRPSTDAADETTLQQANAPTFRLLSAKFRLLWAKPVAMASAALLLLFLGAALWLAFQQKDNTHYSDLDLYRTGSQGYVERVNRSSKPVKVLLSDGSAIILQARSRLKYRANYTGHSTRDVYLLGNAFFEVAKDPYKPFIVHSSEVFTKVLGTSFHIQAPEGGKNILVSVKTGKVSVYTVKNPDRLAESATVTAGPDPLTQQYRSGASQQPGASQQARMDRQGVTLLPNQYVDYRRTEHSFDKRIVDTAQIVNSSITKTDFTFENAPVARVFKTLQHAYGIEILFNEQQMKNCYLTAPLGNEPLFEKVRIICQAIGASYEVIDAKVIITSRGC